MCTHNKYIKLCVKCNKSLICIHNKYKYGCVICRTHLLCIHNIKRHRCKDCKKKYSRSEKRKEEKECIHKNIKTECIYCYLMNFK